MGQSEIMGGVSSGSSSRERGTTRYFSATGCVIEYSDRREVFVGGSLLGVFTPEDKAMRNMMIVVAARAQGVKQGKLAKAFGLSIKTIETVRARFEEGGVQAIVKPGGRERKLTPELVEQLGKLFDRGLTIDEAHKRIRKRVSRAVVGRAHKLWADAKRSREQQEQREKQEKSQQQTLENIEPVRSKMRRAVRKPPAKSTATEAEGKADRNDAELGLERAIARGGQRVQHLGTWIMLAMVQALMFYAYAEQIRTEVARTLAAKGKRFVSAAVLRVALDAAAVALVLGERCVEGVRRVGTASAATLLRHRQVVSPTWVRRVLGRFAEPGGDTLHMALATTLIGLDEQLYSDRLVFYVDNHMRPYTGKNTIRKGWRMQDKRARPGSSDYWVHDEDGRPVMRAYSPEHDSLVRWLRPIGETLRDALQDEQRPVLLVFDRAGAYAEAMMELRDAGFEFITYERKPYPKHPPSAFDHWIQIDDERYEFFEAPQKNLGKGRGRIRRIAVLSPEGQQFNIIGVSEAPAGQLIDMMLGRWARQENQFKHGAERWGLNQLDGRAVDPYPPDAIIPNPTRSRIDRALRLARAAEGEALRRLQRLAATDPKRHKLEQDVRRARAEQEQLETIRPHVPKHAPLKDTELAGKLVKHRKPYKLLLDTLRIALGNAEAELAARLAPHLPRGAEAKKTLKNLLVAPGHVQLNRRSVTLSLSPAGTARERLAFKALLEHLNTLPLSLPGDEKGLRLRFKIENR